MAAQFTALRFWVFTNQRFVGGGGHMFQNAIISNTIDHWFLCPSYMLEFITFTKQWLAQNEPAQIVYAMDD